MANIKSALKRNRQAEKRRLRNRAEKSRVKTLSKQIIDSINENKPTEEIEQQFKNFQKVIDVASRKRIFHKNNAARKKSKLWKKLKNSNI